MHPVARFGRLAVADPVRQHDEKLRRIEWLIFAEKLARKFRPDKLRAATRRPVHNENRVARFALRVLLRFSQRPIMETQLWQCFAPRKFEIANRIVALGGGRIVGGGPETRRQDGQEKCEDSERWIHVNDFVAVRPGFV